MGPSRPLQDSPVVCRAREGSQGGDAFGETTRQEPTLLHCDACLTQEDDDVTRPIIQHECTHQSSQQHCGPVAAASAAGVHGRYSRPCDGRPMPRPPAWTPSTSRSSSSPADPVTITLAGGGPPQRGDYFYVDGPIYAVDDVNGTQIGMYHCFGAWTTAADDTAAPYQRLTTVQFLMDEGSIMGLINELGTEPDSTVGAVQGGTGRYTGALGTFQQLPSGQAPRKERWRLAGPGTPGAGQNVVRAVFELMLPQGR